MNKKSKNQKLLESFTSYCRMYPELRFWQALSSWSGCDFIYIERDTLDANKKPYKVRVDTFYSNKQSGL